MTDSSYFGGFCGYTLPDTKDPVHFESSLVFPVGGGQTRQSWHSQSRSARGNGAPHGTFMARPAGGCGGGEWLVQSVCASSYVYVWGFLHLKFHNICSIGCSVYMLVELVCLQAATVIGGVCVHVCEHVCRLCTHRC